MTNNLNLPTIESVAELATVQRPPCLSLYQPTHRHRPKNQQDPIRFRNLVKALEASLLQKYSLDETQRLLDPFEALAHDSDFWEHTLDGLAVLGSPNGFRTFRLQQPVAELAVVSDTFQTRSLRRYLQSVGRYQILGLSLQSVKLFEGNRDSLDEIDLASGVPRTLTEALGIELSEPHSTVASYGGTGQGTAPMHHGDGGKQDQMQASTERFFRAVDRAVAEHHSQPSGLRLILAALPEHHHLFRQVSHNALLMAEGIPIHPGTLPIDDLRKRAWQIIEPAHQLSMATLANEFAAAKSKGLGSDDLAQIAEHAAAGRVTTLLIDSGRAIGGKVDAVTGKITLDDLRHPDVGDLLDDVGKLVEKMGGRVLVIPTGRMPGLTGLAATYRY